MLQNVDNQYKLINDLIKHSQRQNMTCMTKFIQLHNHLCHFGISNYKNSINNKSELITIVFF
jgi:hypothetical protein